MPPKLCGALSKDDQVFKFAHTLASHTRAIEYGLSSYVDRLDSGAKSASKALLLGGSPERHEGELVTFNYDVVSLAHPRKGWRCSSTGPGADRNRVNSAR